MLLLLHKTVAKQGPIIGKLNLFAGISLCEAFSRAERMDLQQPWPLSRPSPAPLHMDVNSMTTESYSLGLEF